MSSRSWVQAPQGARFRDVMVSISDFESDNPGSNPGGTSSQVTRVRSKGNDLRSFAIRFVGSNPTPSIRSLKKRQLPHWRNWIAHQTSNLGVAGSSPVVGMIVFFIL